MNTGTHTQHPTRLHILFVLFFTLLFTALYEMLWAWIFAGNCCSVNAWYDMPNTIALALALTTAYAAQWAIRADKRARTGLWLLVVVFLVAIPIKKYLGENQASGLLGWYAIFPVIYLVAVGMIASTKKNLRSFMPFLAWGLVLIIEAATFWAQRTLVFSGWGVVFEIVLLLFQTRLLGCYVMLNRKGKL